MQGGSILPEDEVKLSEARGRLRGMVEEDLAQVLEWRNSERVRAGMYTDQVIGWEQHLAWFERVKVDPSTVYLIFEYEGVPAGVVNFSQLDRKNHKGVWGFYLGVEDLPRGAGTLMGRLGLQFAFGELQLHKLSGESLAGNGASIRFHQRLGFRQEGLLKQHVMKDGKFEDVIVFGLLAEGYAEMQERKDGN